MTPELDKMLSELATKYPPEPAYIATVPMQCVHDDCCGFARRIRAAVEEEHAKIDEIISALEADAQIYRKQGGTVTADYVAHVLEIYAEALRLTEVKA